MISDEDRFSILSAYAVGVITRSRAMGRLEMEWYGDLLHAMAAAGLSIHLPEEVCESMRETINKLFDALQPPKN